jgi:hypothetical protein
LFSMIKGRWRLCRKTNTAVNAPLGLCVAATAVHRRKLKSKVATPCRRNTWSIGGRCAIALAEQKRRRPSRASRRPKTP